MLNWQSLLLKPKCPGKSHHHPHTHSNQQPWRGWHISNALSKQSLSCVLHCSQDNPAVLPIWGQLGLDLESSFLWVSTLSIQRQMATQWCRDHSSLEARMVWVNRGRSAGLDSECTVGLQRSVLPRAPTFHQQDFPHKGCSWWPLVWPWGWPVQPHGCGVQGTETLCGCPDGIRLCVAGGNGNKEKIDLRWFWRLVSQDLMYFG